MLNFFSVICYLSQSGTLNSSCMWCWLVWMTAIAAAPPPPPVKIYLPHYAPRTADHIRKSSGRRGLSGLSVRYITPERSWICFPNDLDLQILPRTGLGAIFQTFMRNLSRTQTLELGAERCLPDLGPRFVDLWFLFDRLLSYNREETANRIRCRKWRDVQNLSPYLLSQWCVRGFQVEPPTAVVSVGKC